MAGSPLEGFLSGEGGKAGSMASHCVLAPFGRLPAGFRTWRHPLILELVPWVMKSYLCLHHTKFCCSFSRSQGSFLSEQTIPSTAHCREYWSAHLGDLPPLLHHNPLTRNHRSQIPGVILPLPGLTTSPGPHTTASISLSPWTRTSPPLPSLPRQ